MAPQSNAELWAERADAAEAAMLARHLRRLWGLPGHRLGVVAWPATWSQRLFLPWDYWWQAHLLDCAVDAAGRTPTAARRERIADIVRGHRVRNLTGWTNRYYDDMGWLALALERAEPICPVDVRAPLHTLATAVADGRDADCGAIAWRVGSDYFNAPANGPAGILFARLNLLDRAVELADWLDKTLCDRRSGLILDGIHLPSGRVESAVYTYCQGVALGLDVELAVRTGEPRFAARAAGLIAAVDDRLTEDGVIVGAGGGDGGLFDGILARYLALAALMLPGDEAELAGARTTAATLVLASAEAAWANRLEVEGDPLFGASWRLPARIPGAREHSPRTGGGSVGSSPTPERDLSVQLSGWMLMEAAHRVAAAGF